MGRSPKGLDDFGLDAVAALACWLMAQAVTREAVSGTAVRARKRKPFLLDLYGTAVGKKYVMAITGLIGLGYVIAQMVGNLKMYLGPEDIDHYSEWLRDLLVPLFPRTVALWLMRIVLIVALVLHLHAAYTLTLINRRARPEQYKSPRDYVAANFASRTMRWTGIIVLLFLFYHLADLTWGWFNPDFVRGAVYHNLDQSLSQIPVAILYIVANIALGIHLFHGIWSLFQSMGWNSPRFNAWRRGVATGLATLIVVGNVSFPIAVQAGIVQV
jgi:succinate dehydrogenase / fumarate reductase cytochrome b subunit